MYLPRFVGGLLEDRGTSKLSVHSWVTAGGSGMAGNSSVGAAKVYGILPVHKSPAVTIVIKGPLGLTPNVCFQTVYQSTILTPLHTSQLYQKKPYCKAGIDAVYEISLRQNQLDYIFP